MNSKAKKIVSLEQKIQSLQLEKKKTQVAMEQEKLKHLKKLGLFDLSDSELYGFVMASLKHKETQRGVWKIQGERFLDSNKPKSKITKTSGQTDCPSSSDTAPASETNLQGEATSEEPA